MNRYLLAAALAATFATPAAAGSYVVCDNGLRCIMAPCPSTNAYDVKTKRLHKGVEVDISRMSAADRSKVERSNGLYEGTLVVSGKIASRKVKGPAGTKSVPFIVAGGIERKSGWGERRACRR